MCYLQKHQDLQHGSDSPYGNMFEICALTLPKKTQHPKLTIKHHKIDRLSLYKEHSRTAVLAETSFESERWCKTAVSSTAHQFPKKATLKHGAWVLQHWSFLLIQSKKVAGKTQARFAVCAHHLAAGGTAACGLLFAPRLGSPLSHPSSGKPGYRAEGKRKRVNQAARSVITSSAWIKANSQVKEEQTAQLHAVIFSPDLNSPTNDAKSGYEGHCRPHRSQDWSNLFPLTCSGLAPFCSRLKVIVVSSNLCPVSTR